MYPLILIVSMSMVAQPPAPPADPLAQLNSIRASYGLTMVYWDAGAAATSAANNAYGVGHAVMDGGPQVSAMAVDPFGDWLRSPGHAAILLDPNLYAAGFASNGVYATLTGRTAGWGGMVARSATTVRATPAGVRVRSSSYIGRRRGPLRAIGRAIGRVGGGC